MASTRKRATPDRRRGRTPRARTIAKAPSPRPKRVVELLSPAGEKKRGYPELRVLDERPADGNDRAVRAITELVELVDAGKGPRNGLLRRLVNELFLRIVDGATDDGYFADDAMTVEDVAALLVEHVVLKNRGLRTEEPGARAMARALQVVARRRELSASALNGVSFSAAAALAPLGGESDPKTRLVRKDVVERMERDVQRELVAAFTAADDLGDVALGIAVHFYKVHDSGFRWGDVLALSRKLREALERDGQATAPRKLLMPCARHVGAPRGLFNFENAAPKKKRA